MKQYKARIVDRILYKKLREKGAVLIEGPKWCGKTTTAEQVAKSILYMDDPKTEKQNLQLADINPALLLEGNSPRLIDEWQLAPKLWDAIRFTVDHRDEMGQFILTGSATPVDTDLIHHTGTGRFSWLLMRPMSLYESGESTGEVSLRELFQAPDEIIGRNKLTLQDIAFLTCRGGWPRACEMEEDIALSQAIDYYEAVVRSDINRADGVVKNPERVKRFIRSSSRYLGTQTPITGICEDMAANEGTEFSNATAYSYQNALKKIFVVEDMPAWNPNLRSKTAIRTADTRYFTDPSIGAAALGLGQNDLINDLNTFGLLFENLCIRDLRVFADALDGSVYHYRDKNGLECDAVVHLRNGSYGLVEIKLGGDSAIEYGVTTLKKIQRLIDTKKMKEPSFLMILTGTGDFAFRRADGVYVVPIGCLKD